MSSVKFFEIRDEATCIPVMAVKMVANNMGEDWLLRRGGFNLAGGFMPVQLTWLIRGESHFDPFRWGNTGVRTIKTAHQYITDNFDQLVTGAVIDVQFILGETSKPKISDNPDKVI